MKHFISRRNFLKAAGVTAAASAMAAAVPQASAGFLTGKDAAVTILYTNDVHTYIDNKSPKLTYAAIAAMRQYPECGRLRPPAGRACPHPHSPASWQR